MSEKHALPGPYPIKVITRNVDDIRQYVLEAVQRVFPKFSEDLMREKASGGNKYLSFTVTVYAETEQQLKKLNDSLRANSDVMTVL